MRMGMRINESMAERAALFWEELNKLQKDFGVKSINVTTDETCEARFEDGTFVVIDDSSNGMVLIGRNSK